MSDKREIPFGRPWITEAERQAVLGVLKNPILTHGPKGREFEEAFSEMLGGGCYCVSTSSCMAALHLASFHFGFGQGDEVIVPAMTHVATAHAVEVVGARPVFVDCELETGNIDPAGIEAAITPRTKAISLVHYLGIPCPMDEITSVVEKHGLILIEDCALAVGTKYKGSSVALFGDVGCFSFYPVKHITTGEGGMFVTKHPEVARVAAKQRAFGVDRKHDQRSRPGIYDVNMLGFNYRLSEVQAALGLVQLKRMDEIQARRRENFELLKGRLSALDRLHLLDVPNDRGLSSHYCLGVRLSSSLADRRDEVVDRLRSRGIGTSVYYPHPVPRLTYYRQRYGYDPEKFKNAADLADNSIAFPVGPHLNPEDMEYMAREFRAVLDSLDI